METKTKKIEYRKQGENPIEALHPLTDIGELIWDGVYRLYVTADDGKSGLPTGVADNDSMTLVVKEHAHDGNLQNSRTIVQTITRVECTTGKVSVYNRTRHYNNGKHRWTDWELACDENGHPTFDNNTVQQVEKNKNAIANEIIRAKSMDEGLDARVTANATDLAFEIARAQSVEQNIKSSLRSTTPRVYIGGLQENGDPYPGTSYSAYSAPVTGNGEIVVSDGYCIDAIKMFAKDGTALSYNNYNGQSYTFDDSYDYQFSFRRKDNGKFTADELKRVVQSLILDTIVWGAGKDLNNYRCAGEYHIDGKRENTVDNMPIYNIGNINARLTVLNAGGCVTQVLTLLNIGGGDSNIYTRTMQNGTWSMWNKLQSNVEVGAIGLGQTRTFDHLTDNGIYSGVNVYATATDDNGYPITAFETFVLITINAYLTGGGVSQLKYSLLPDGTTCVAKRSKQENTWSEWRDLESDISTMNKLQTTVDNLVNENTRAKEVEKNVKRTAVDISSLTCTDGKKNVTITGKSMDGEVVHSVEIPAATTEKAGVMSAEDKKQLYSTKPYTFVYNSSSLSNGYVDGNADTYTETATTALKYMAVSVEEGMQCTLTSVRRNLGYMYIIYDANNNKISAYAGTNATVITQEFTIPKGGVKLAVNCDSAYLDSFALSIVGNPTLLSRVMELEKKNIEFDVLSAKNRIVYTLGSSTIDMMKTTTNADGVKDWSYLGQLLGAKKLYNIAIGGSTWQTQGIDTDTPDINTTATRSASNQIKMLKRLVDSGKYEYPEIIFLQFTNGYSGSGTITDNMEQVMAMSFDELEVNTNIRQLFYGGVRYALELLNRYFPKATYYVSDGIQCDRDLPYRRGYEYVKSGRDELKKMCDRYSCPFLETSRSIGIVDLYEHGSKTSTSNIEIFTGATATGTIVLSLKDNNINVSVTAGDTANVVAQKIANAVNSSNIGWAATLNGSKVLLSVAKESAAVPEFNAASTGVSVDITFNQFADDYDGIYLSTDGLHPNEKGKQLIARCVAKGILETYFEKQ